MDRQVLVRGEYLDKTQNEHCTIEFKLQVIQLSSITKQPIPQMNELRIVAQYQDRSLISRTLYCGSATSTYR